MPPLLALELFAFAVIIVFFGADDEPELPCAEEVTELLEDTLMLECDVVVAERLVIVPVSVVSAAVVVAFGAADDVSVLTFPQPVTPSIAAVISREAIVLVISVLVIVESSFFRLDIYLKVVYTYI